MSKDNKVTAKRLLCVIAEHNLLWDKLVDVISKLYDVDAWEIVKKEGLSYYKDYKKKEK